MAARDAASAARRAASTEVSSCFREGGGQGAHGWPQMITVVPASRCDWTSARSWSKYGVEIVAGLEGGGRGLDLDALRLELLGGPLTGLVAAAVDERDPVGPRAEGDGVERFEQLGLGAHVRRRRRDELRLGDDGVTVGGVELVPLWPCLELGDRGALGVGELLCPLGHLGAQGGDELGEERCDRIRLVEELATITDGGDRRCDSLGHRQPVGVAEQALQVAPCGLALLAACCQRLASVRGRR